MTELAEERADEIRSRVVARCAGLDHCAVVRREPDGLWTVDCLSQQPRVGSSVFEKTDMTRLVTLGAAFVVMMTMVAAALAAVFSHGARVQ